MSWGFWGVVTALVTFLAGFFVCMEVLYSSARDAGKDKTAAVRTASADESGPDAKHHAA